MTGPDEPDQSPEPATPEPAEDRAGDAARPAPDAPGRGAGGSRRHGRAHELGAEVRGMRRDLDELRRILAETTGYVAEALPRIKDLEDVHATLAARLDHVDGHTGTDADPDTSPAGGSSRDSSDAGEDDPENDAEHDEAPPATPATGWSQMDRVTATAAWEALARFVGEVLHGEYRLTRMQVPDCWPLHPRMVRELAWLRSSYLEAADAEPDVPSSSSPWHIRALPAFFINTADAIDPRECRPGIHRLTEPEVDAYLGACNAARDAGRPAPEPSTETGAERPRLRPEHFPTRSTSPRPRHDPHGQAPAPTARSLPDLLVGSCHPDFWLDNYYEASTADLQRRAD